MQYCRLRPQSWHPARTKGRADCSLSRVRHARCSATAPDTTVEIQAQEITNANFAPFGQVCSFSRQVVLVCLQAKEALH